MTSPSPCPDCGPLNAAALGACGQCNFPLAGAKPTADPLASPSAPPTDSDLSRVRPIRSRPPRAPLDPMSQQLWLIVGMITIGLLLWQAFTGFRKSNTPPPVAGAQPEQQQLADQAREAIAKDSTDLRARIALADVMYDTGNWPEAIVHYRSALRLDPTRVTTVVDLGVCYYNLSDVSTAETLFQEALSMDPRQPVALFNLGVVAESRKEDREALGYYQRAMDANPPEGMKPPLTQRLAGVKQRLGAAPR